MLGNESMKILELFAGSKSIGNAAKEFGHDVFSIDWKDYGGIDMIADIEFLQTDSIDFIPDVVWASPDCATYSLAAIYRHRKGTEAKKCDRVNLNFLKLIDEWQKQNPSLLYFIENPRGMMRKMPWMQKHKKHEIWYCQYGDSRAKPTDIWTNSNDWKPRQKCFNGNTNCHHEKVPRGSNKGTQGRSGSYERSKIPDELCKEIIESIQIKKCLEQKA
jgi:hypothetical protein